MRSSVDRSGCDLRAALSASRRPLNQLGDGGLCPGAAALEKINAGLR
jgi:2-oxoglutarate ferredoxin oxidoreductase subunit beta